MNIEIEYYSGTGCTALAAESLRTALMNAGNKVGIRRITSGAEDKQPSLPDHDKYILLFPVHAFNAPEAVYKRIETLSPPSGATAAVIDVSGGGDVCPNRACRVSVIKRLKKKGYEVVNEDSLVMPSNYMIPTNEKLAVKLLEALPEKTKQIAESILIGGWCRDNPPLLDRLASRLGELEKVSAKKFGMNMDVSETCDGCGLCAENCPAGNIILAAAKPVFADKCHLCLCCVYVCPQKALIPKKYKSIVLKEGFDLTRLQEMVPLQESVDISKLAKGYFWSGVKKYLTQN